MSRDGGWIAFRRARIGALVVLLLLTLAWAARTQWARGARADWSRPLQVGIVLLDPGVPVDVEGWRRAAETLASGLAGEKDRWLGPGAPPFAIAVAGPVRFDGTLPIVQPEGAWLDRAWHAIEVYRTVREVDRSAGGTVGGFDVRVFVRCTAAPDGRLGFAEGAGALNGEVAFVRGSCAGDLAIPIQAVGHELLHTVGAEDKYDAGGHAVAPDGLAEPDRVPTYPQSYAEWMVGEVPLAPGRGRLPVSVGEMRVGPETAREIGWVR